GVHVALVEQPYRVEGRRAPAPARQLDEAWLAVTARLAEGVFADLPLVFGGRSSGARVACRTAAAGGALAVLCLAFPLHPPGRPDKSRHDELDRVDVPVLVVQGDRDPFGRPEPRAGREIVLLSDDHSLKANSVAVGRAVAEWLRRSLRPRGHHVSGLCECRRRTARTADTGAEIAPEWARQAGRCSKRGNHSPETFSPGRA
ncbi:MAG: alpha/beta hydrolase family protein, partial [Pseudonocardiaceae bacterium]